MNNRGWNQSTAPMVAYYHLSELKFICHQEVASNITQIWKKWSKQRIAHKYSRLIHNSQNSEQLNNQLNLYTNKYCLATKTIDHRRHTYNKNKTKCLENQTNIVHNVGILLNEIIKKITKREKVFWGVLIKELRGKVLWQRFSVIVMVTIT